jgi:glyoxylase-like metal-dependent hydrolase (beta-lactamase superfamily II)
VRKLAADNKEQLPIDINMLTIATGKLPSFGVVAGAFGEKDVEIDFPSFQLVYEDKTAIIEAPFSRRLFDRCPYGEEYYQDNYEIMQKALLEAEFFLATHEHWDHLGGIAQSKHIGKLLPKAIFTNEQINGPTIVDAEFPEGVFDGYASLEYADYHRVAPGVVVIKAPGHSVGHQFVYVHLQNGREFLFIGDVVWANKNFRERKNRPWLASKKRLENRRQISHQMKYLHDEFYANEGQSIKMIATHDPRQHQGYIQAGLMNSGFQVGGQL